MSFSLIIDTAFETCQAALARDGKIVAEDKTTSGGGHDRVLATMVEKLFAQQKTTAKDLDKIIITTGPGRFTGLRVGIAFARGLALVNDTPLVGVNTMDAIALDLNAAYPSEKNLGVVVSVKRGENFVQYIKPEKTEILTVADENMMDSLSAHHTPLIGGVLSPFIRDALIGAGLKIAGITEPSLTAILTLGEKEGPSAVVRPYYAASYGT